MREHLLGYLMGALEPHETQEVETHLCQDDRLRRELDALRFCLHPLKADEGHLDPPDGLATRTFNYVVARAAAPAARSSASSRGWRLTDVLTAACVAAAAALVFFPAVSYSRYQSESAMCQNNLRQIGAGLAQYSQFHGGYFPELPTAGNEAAAGLHALILRERGYVEQDSTFLCPGSALAASRRAGSQGEFSLPTREQVLAASGEALESLRRAMGGAYAYPLGYLENGTYRVIRNRNRGTFAIVADAPNVRRGRADQSANHRGRGQNVLFEDFHVSFLTTCRTCPSDDLYNNDDGHIAAGNHANDAVVGPSEATPLGWKLVE
jgi:hypothetical protein